MKDSTVLLQRPQTRVSSGALGANGDASVRYPRKSVSTSARKLLSGFRGQTTSKFSKTPYFLRRKTPWTNEKISAIVIESAPPTACAPSTSACASGELWKMLDRPMLLMVSPKTR
eukprot:scaffold391_cov223-Pinguiococcus_pyrenoidosus.AAC.11